MRRALRSRSREGPLRYGVAPMPRSLPDRGAPGRGRVFAEERAIRLGDVLPSGEARLDALARFLQDVAADDAADAGVDRELTWVVRRTGLAVARRPRLGERVALATWASGAGSRWAERRTTMRTSPSSGGEVLVEGAGLWVCLDRASGRPARLSRQFLHIYGESIGERTVSSRLTHGEPPAGLAGKGRPWPLRVADMDVLEHLNNAAAWMAVEDELQRRAPGRAVAWAELEYRAGTGLDADLRLCSQVGEDEARVWLVADGQVQVSAAAWFSTGDVGADAPGVNR